MLKDLRIKAGLTQRGMSELLEIPKRSIENWEGGIRTCPKYVENLIKEKLEDLIIKKGINVIKKAKEMDIYNQSLPEVIIGDIISLKEIWDGNGDVPTSSYSYTLDDNSNWINYSFTFENESIVEIINNLDSSSESYDEDMDTILKSEIKITDIELL